MVVIILILVMSVSLLAIHNYTDGVGRETGANDAYLQANAAASAAVDVVIGRLTQWINYNSGYGPSITDCATVGVPGNSSFPAITGTITFPAGSTLSNFTVSTPVVYPVLPDDTVVTGSSSTGYLPPVSQRVNVSDNSATCADRFYFTRSGSTNAPNVPCRSLTYQITVTVTPKVSSLTAAKPLTLVRYFRVDKVNPFAWCTYRGGSATYGSGLTYTGPMYFAHDVTFDNGTFTSSVLYGQTATNVGASFTGGGYAAQVKQTTPLTLIPNLVGAMAVDASGNRLASYETNTTVGGAPNDTATDPADMFSTREVIEPPTNPSSDTTPTVFKNARIFNQADARIQVYVTKVGASKVVTKQVVDTSGNVMSAVTYPWITPLLAAVNVNTTSAGSAGAFMDHDRSTSQSVQSTDVNVGAVATVMNANPTAFPTGILYVWDSSGPISGVTPLTGVRVWNAGVLPNVGLELGTDDPIYMRGDFNTGTTLPANATVDSYPSVMPYSSYGMAVNDNQTTEAQRTVSGYTIKPGGLFGDSMTELSNSWTDTNSSSTEQASNTTYNLVEGWTSMSANELRSDDSYLDTAGRANPLWIESWSGTRRTMSGEEFVMWHSKYGDSTSEGYNGGWSGDISYDSNATALKLDWGQTTFVHDRVTLQ